MDDPDVPRGDLLQSLAYLRLVNRRLGGVSALLGHLRRWSRRWPSDRPVTLLDIGTGSGDLPIAAVRLARALGRDLRVTAIDSHTKTLDAAREHVGSQSDVRDAIELECVDARRLMDRFDPLSFDYTHAGLFLHHLPDIEVLTVLRMMDRLACAGVVWNDLVRSAPARVGVRLITLGRPHIIKHDARVSVRAGFTRREALEVGRRVGIDYASYRSSIFTQRFTLAGEKPDAWR